MLSIITSPPRPRTMIGIAVAGVLCYTALGIWGGVSQVVTAASAIGFGPLAAGLCLVLLNIAIRYVRWRHYLARWGCRTPWWFGFQSYVAGFAVAATPGGAGEPFARALFLKRFGLSYAESAGAYIAERFADVLAMLSITAWGIYAYAPAQPYVIAMLLFVLAALAIATRRSFLHRSAAALRGGSRTKRAIAWIISVIALVGELSRCTTLVWSVSLGIAAWALQALVFHALLLQLGVAVTLQKSALVYGFSCLLGAFSFLPAGIVATELSMASLLVFFGATDATAIAGTIVTRAITLWFAIVLGAACFWHLLRRRSVRGNA